jgi:hypothetical protein
VFIAILGTLIGIGALGSALGRAPSTFLIGPSSWAVYWLGVGVYFLVTLVLMIWFGHRTTRSSVLANAIGVAVASWIVIAGW